MELPGQSRIASRTRRQTMDWGLALISQGIQATIDDGADGAGWALWVPAGEYAAALRVIQLYERENRRWRWRQPWPWRGFHFDWKVIGWCALLIGFQVATQFSSGDAALAGRMDNAAVWRGEWWRIFTAMLLHANAAHLASNVGFGFLLLGLAMGRFGSGCALLAAYLAGAAGNAAGLLVYPGPHYGLGASGMVMGGLGLLAAQSLALLRQGVAARKYVVRALGAGGLLFALFGLDPNTDVVAHLGGFLAGLGLGSVLSALPNRWRGRRLEGWAAAIFCGLLIGTGWMAFGL